MNDQPAQHDRPLTIAVGSDDAGIEYKEALAAQLRDDPRVSAVVDVGVQRDEHTAYPHVATDAARRVAEGNVDRALLICGTGIGMAIVANKTPGVRAATGHDLYSVERSILSNNAQILTMGQRVVGLELASRLVDRWLDLEFDSASPSAAKVALIEPVEPATPSPGAQADPGARSAQPERAIRSATVGSRSGLHARPAKIFAQRAKETGLSVWISRNGGERVRAGSVLSVMSIGAGQGEVVTIEVEGAGAGRVADELAALAAADLDE